MGVDCDRLMRIPPLPYAAKETGLGDWPGPEESQGGNGKVPSRRV